MGAVIADLIGKACGRSWPDMRTLLASGAGAGLAVAFNAPIAGAVFVLEELVRRLETRIAIAALGASSTAILVSRLFLGDAPDFQVRRRRSGGECHRTLPYAVRDLATLPGPRRGRRGGGGLLQPCCPRRDVAGDPGRSALAGRSPGRGDQRSIGIVGWFAPGLIGGGEAVAQHLLAGGLPSGPCRSPSDTFWTRCGVLAVLTPAGCSHHCSWSVRSSGCCSARWRRPAFPVSA